MLLITLKLIKIHDNAYFQRIDPKLEISRHNCFQFNVFQSYIFLYEMLELLF